MLEQLQTDFCKTCHDDCDHLTACQTESAGPSFKVTRVYERKKAFVKILDLDQYVTYHPFTGISAMVGVGSLPALLAPGFLPESIQNRHLTFDGRWYCPGGSSHEHYYTKLHQYHHTITKQSIITLQSFIAK